MKKVVSFSGGKDSTAMLLRMIELGMEIDEIRYFDCGSWEFPQMKRHVDKVERYIKRSIKRMSYKYSFDYLFARIKKKDGRIGYGFPIMNFRWCTGRKMDTLKKKGCLSKTLYCTSVIRLTRSKGQNVILRERAALRSDFR